MRVAIGLALVLAACSSQASDTVTAAQPTEQAVESTRHAVSGLEVVPLTISHNGKVHSFRVEVAKSPREQALGLMFRKEMGPDEGMIFPFSPPQGLSFWMRNTELPLDIIFIGTDHKIINIHAKTEPFSLEPLPSEGLAIAALELNGGRMEELGFAPGALVEW